MPDHPLENGNTNGIGIVIRDHQGRFIMGLMGPIKEVTHFQAQLWAIHTSMKEAYSRNYNDLCIETEHLESFRILRRRNFDEASREGVVKIIQDINACNPLSPLPYEPTCRIYTIFEERNQLARFLAFKGMHSCSEIVSVDLSLPGFREVLEDDIGWGQALEGIEILPNFGNGEVIDGPKPKRKKTIKIAEDEYWALNKVADRVDMMENQLQNQMVNMGVQDEAFNMRSDSVFAIKYDLSTQGIKFSDKGPMPQQPMRASSSLIPNDKGKGKMYVEDTIPPLDSATLVSFQSTVVAENGHTTVPIQDSLHSMSSLGRISLPEVPIVPPSSPVLEQKKNASTQVDESLILGTEASEFMVQSVMGLIDKPIVSNELMEMDALMLEWALFEETAWNSQFAK